MRFTTLIGGLAAAWFLWNGPVSPAEAQYRPIGNPGASVPYRDGPVANDYADPTHPRSTPRGEDMTWGWRNPGGVGRNPEYYPPGNQFQSPGSPVVPSRYDLGPIATRREMQIQSYNAGTARYNAIQTHIDRYGMPRIGFWGFGLGYGMGYPY